jgi:TPR repeat protein
MESLMNVRWLLLGIPIMVALVVFVAMRSNSIPARAGRGDASAQYQLGVMYLNGDGVPQDYVSARRP